MAYVKTKNPGSIRTRLAPGGPVKKRLQRSLKKLKILVKTVVVLKLKIKLKVTKVLIQILQSGSSTD